MPTLRRLRLLLLAAALSAPLTLAACRTSPHIDYIPDGGSYTMDEALARISSDVPEDVSSLHAQDAGDARRDALAGLRSIDASASALADLIVASFPSEMRSVPVLAESAVVDGREAWILVEAWGGSTGPLDARRVWILDRSSGEILSSATGD